MSEFEFRESASTETGRIEREGLPPGYRMRADAHYVDALSGSPSPRADRVREVSRPATLDEPAVPDASSARDRRLFDQLAEDVAAIESAAAMLTGDGSALGRRVGLDLIKAQSARAAWLLRAHAMQQSADALPAGRRRPLAAVLADIRDRAGVECRLVGVGLDVQAADESGSVTVTDAALMVAITGAIMAQLGLVAGTDGAVIRVQAAVKHGETLTIDVAQDAIALPAASQERFFDAGWVTRPGGWLAAMGAASARVAAERQGGTAILVSPDRRGCNFRLTMPIDRV